MRVILLDFWGVIGVVQTPADVAGMAARMGADPQAFSQAYWDHRSDYDAGGDREEFWASVAAQVGVEMEPAMVTDLGDLDVASWSRTDPQMLELVAQLKAQGHRLALLSNAPLDLVDHASEVLADLVPDLLFSSHLGLAKPDPRIFAEALRVLQVVAGEVVFVDDNEDNVRSARAVGMDAVHHVSVEKTRTRLMG